MIVIVSFLSLFPGLMLSCFRVKKRYTLFKKKLLAQLTDEHDILKPY